MAKVLSRSERIARSRRYIALNVFCPTGEGGGVDPTCSPKGKKLHPTETVAFKKWFGKSKVVDKDGKPLAVYHGTLGKEDFNEFRTDVKKYPTLDQMIGSHFAEDIKSSESFSVKSDGRVGRIYPVYLSIQKPKIIHQETQNGKLEHDAWAINRDIRGIVFPNNKPLFVKWAMKARNLDKESAGEIFDRLSKGESIGENEYNGVSGHNLNSPRIPKGEHPVSSYIGNYDSAFNMFSDGEQRALVETYKAELRKQGYDGIRYTNTAPMETSMADVTNPTAWIAFGPSQIKSAIGNKGTFDPNDPLITNVRKKPINPLRSDPSRTTTLRRGFEEQLQKRLSSFSQSLVKLLVTDKALGITANAFCPTGEGGGIDPTCSPSGKLLKGKGISGVLSPDMKHHPLAGESGHELIYRKISGEPGLANGIVNGGFTRLNFSYGFLGVETSYKNLTKVKRWLRSNVDPHGVEQIIYTVYGKDGSAREITEVTNNVFCPTGPGGGVDPTCSPKGKKSAKKKSKVVWFSQDDEEMDYDLAEEALQVAKLSGINILSDKELTAATIEGGKVTGALFTGLSGDVYSFDVAVDPAHQGRGIGSQLTDLGLQNFDSYSEMGASIKLDAVNPQMVEMLKRRGFSVTQQFGGHQIMERLTANAPNWSFDTPQSKIDNFEQWIISKLSETMNEKDIHSGVNWWQLYIERAYKLGAGRTFDEVRKRGTIKKPEWYQGTKEQFLSSSFNNPVSVDRLKVLVGRTHKALKGFTEAMRSQLTQELTDGLIQGLSPREIAKNLTKRIGINKHRAMTIARTEIVRSHAEGQLASLRALGINEIGVDVEFTTARNPCPICNKLKGKVFTIAQAEGLIPRHPNCFIGPGVKIYTVDGWKPIASIKVGDLVLTHQGRFRKVTQLHRNTGTDVHVVEFRIKGSGTNSQIKITSEHPVMVNKTWRPAREIQVGHKVRWMSSACQGCGKPIPYGRKYHNQTCQWMDPTQVQNLGEKITKSLNEQYESGRRDRKQTVKAAHEKIYQLSLQGKFRRKPASTERNGAKQPEARKKISRSKLGSLNPMRMYPNLRREQKARIKDQHERDHKSHVNYKLSLKARKGNLESLTDIELKMYRSLAQRGIQAEYNYHIDRLWIDFAIPEHKIAIECDGEYWHKKEVDDVRDKHLQELGWTVLRFKGKRINRNVEGCIDQVERLLKNHEGEYTFCDFEVVEVIHRDITKTQLYNFSVEEDESYIAKGCVVHNCKCAFVPHVSSKPSPQKEYRRKSIESSIQRNVR